MPIFNKLTSAVAILVAMAVSFSATATAADCMEHCYSEEGYCEVIESLFPVTRLALTDWPQNLVRRLVVNHGRHRDAACRLAEAAKRVGPQENGAAAAPALAVIWS